ncbi:MAG TPA: hypothetical protein EYQ50_10710 [Verrucomicrobiales bacterium]|nr:hypothetical protein [Verrucomicrobiales bacterium]HIL71319.1 hypothetical protein [Verrucomicrobiota bacterium]
MVVFLGGFSIMVLEIIGARYLIKDFGSAFYVWISQIGVILIALSLGYYFGGALADRFRSLQILAGLISVAGIFIMAIPHFANRLIEKVVLRHPIDQEIPMIWQKLDPVIGSGLVFFFPCLVLAMIGPCMIRVLSKQLEHVGRISGQTYAFSTFGSIVGVFLSGFVFLDHLRISNIFRLTGLITLLSAGLCLAIARRKVSS